MGSEKWYFCLIAAESGGKDVTVEHRLKILSVAKTRPTLMVTEGLGNIFFVHWDN